MDSDFSKFKVDPRDYFRNKNLYKYNSFQVNIALAYRLIEDQSVFPKITESELNEFSIHPTFPERIDMNLRNEFRKWIISSGFDELFKWIKELLIDYIFLKDVLKNNKWPSSENEFYLARKELYKLDIPHLIKKSKSYCGELNILDYFVSYNAARNCLHHRNEILTPDFCTNPEKNILEIQGRRILLISENENEKKELLLGQLGLENGSIKIDFWDFKIIKKVNEQITFSLQEFNWIKDLGIIMYADLSIDLFGKDDRPLIEVSLKYSVADIGPNKS